MRRAILLLMTLCLAACATTERLDAAGDVHALMVSIARDDKPAFEARIDRSALEAALQERLVARTRASRAPEWLQGLGVTFSGALSHAAVATLARPRVLRGIAEAYGYRAGQPLPGVIAIASDLKPIGDGRVCAVLARGGPCALFFADEGGTWRLVDFDLDLALARLHR